MSSLHRDEKDPAKAQLLQLPNPDDAGGRRTRRAYFPLLVFLCVFVYGLTSPDRQWITTELVYYSTGILLSPSSTPSLSTCHQFPARAPPASRALDGHRHFVLHSEEYKNHSVSVLSGLVQVRSESFDDFGEVGQDPRFDVFFNVEEYLEKRFPLVHQKAYLLKINMHGLLYTIPGTDSTLKPALYMGHVDTVPVNSATLDEWTYPPFSGHYDGTYLWGRGSFDCKHVVSALFEAMTLLLEGGFSPKRTILLSFGFDEEVSGHRGAQEIANFLKAAWGENELAFILDEGGLGVQKMHGTGFALPSTSEKGYLDVKATLHTPGGHSSVPPPHTGIGILASLVTSLESSLYLPSLSTDSPIFDFLQCLAEYGDVPGGFKKSIREGSEPGKKGEKARLETAEKFAEMGRTERYLVTTSQAVDIFHAGTKINNLVEESHFIVNHRVSIDSNSDFVKEKITNHAKVIAERHNLNLTAFGESFSYAIEGKEKAEVPSGGLLVLEVVGELDPASVSSKNSSAWELLASSIQHAYGQKFEELIVSPSIMTGNTDTRHFRELSSNIFRFLPADRLVANNMHTVNERVLFQDHLEAVWFYHELMRNADEAVL